MFYASVGAEVLRICRATSNLHDTTLSVKSLISRMYRQGATEYILKKSLIKCLTKHRIAIAKFNMSTEALVNEFMG